MLTVQSTRWRGVVVSIWTRLFRRWDDREANERQAVTAKQAAARELTRRRRSLDAAIRELEDLQKERSGANH